MTIRIKVPTQLRSLTEGAPETEVEGSTVAEVISALEARHPGFRERLLDESGGLRRFVNVYVDEEDVRFQQGLDTSVPEGSQVAIIPAVAGG
jgi:molybdopterin synthase sulfur carrier subunit